MITQTEGLRRFVADRASEPWRASDDCVVVVGSGKGGSGGSTVATLVALACAGEGRRTLLIDADEQVGTLHRLLGVEARHGVDSLRSGTLAPADAVIELSPLLSLLPGGAGAGAESHFPSPTLALNDRRSLFRRVAQLYGDYDIVIIDAGSRLDTVVAASTPAASRFVVVTGVEPVALASAYALVKAIDTKWSGAPIEVLVNGHHDGRARTAFREILLATARFLGRDIAFAGVVPDDDELRAAVFAGTPLAPVATRTRAGHAARLLATRLLAELNDPRPASAPLSSTRRS
jgi:flagellar biosynthesis protein FlhG